MPTIFERIRTLGWAVIEAAVFLIVLCMLLDIIIGPQTDSFVSGVSKNATTFLNAVPSGTVVGFALVVAVFALVRNRLRP
jgi:nitrate reductase gamma subunit